MKTKAAVLYELGRPLVIEELDVPALRQGEVLVRLLYSGLCRSQYNEIKGLKGPDPYLPHLLGHEGSGVVESVGTKVKKVKRGDYVILSWMKGPGLDTSGITYTKGAMGIRSGAVATLTQRAVVAENRVTKISRTISPEAAALIGCAAATGAGIVFNTLKLSKRSSILIFGVGGIGGAALLAASAVGCRQIVAVDIHPEKLLLAQKWGAQAGLNSRDPEFKKKLAQLCPAGVDCAVEASGSKAAMELAFESVKDSGMVVLAGNAPRGERIAIDPFDLIKGKTLIGSWGGETSPAQDFPRYARLFLAGRFPIDRLVTHRFPLEKINEAVSLLETGQAGRILIQISEDI